MPDPYSGPFEPRMPVHEFDDTPERYLSYDVRLLADSLAPCGKRLTTFVLRYPRFVHADFMTHRHFCLAGDSVLEFDLPAGNHGKNSRRVYKMTIAEFVHKWQNGAKPHKTRWGTERTYDLKPRLRKMRIRQLNEVTGEIETSTVEDAVESGLKPVYEVRAGTYKVAGSADHRILTSDGWKTIGDIRTGDLLIVSTRKKPVELKTDELRLKKINGRWRSTWQNQQRDRLQAEDILCRDCRQSPGLEIHHIVPVFEDQTRAFDTENITLLCDHCHDVRHRKPGWQTGVPLYAGQVAVDDIRFRGIEPTYDLTIHGDSPNFLANQVVVHNSRNAASARAIPVHKFREIVRQARLEPIFWGKNQSGMQAREELDASQPIDDVRLDQLRKRWKTSPLCASSSEVEFGVQQALLKDACRGLRADSAAKSERDMAKSLWGELRDISLLYHEQLETLGVHKQIANRLIEPFLPITVIVSGTEWENFFWLRDHEDAQPELQVIATKAHHMYRMSTPKYLREGEWHLPFIDDDEWELASMHENVRSLYQVPGREYKAFLKSQPWFRRMLSPGVEEWILHEKRRRTIETLKKISVGRCARVSYLNHDGKRSIEDDIALHDKLIAGDRLHVSPFEHVAQASKKLIHSGPFIGWKQYRKEIEGESGPQAPVYTWRDSRQV